MIIEITGGTDNPLASWTCAWRRILHIIVHVVQYNWIFWMLQNLAQVHVVFIQYSYLRFSILSPVVI